MRIFRFYLVLEDFKFEIKNNILTFIPGKKSVSFSRLKSIITSLKGVRPDLEYCKKYKEDKDCYYTLKNKGESVRFEINHGDKNLPDNLSEISIDTKPDVPSKDTRKKVIKLIKIIITKVPMKIYSVNDDKFISFKKLKSKINEKDESVEALLRLRSMELKKRAKKEAVEDAKKYAKKSSKK